MHAWAWESDVDPASIVSNTMTTEWPRGAGRTITFPEVDRCAWFTAVSARGKINAAQAELITGREAALDSGSSS